MPISDGILPKSTDRINRALAAGAYSEIKRYLNPNDKKVSVSLTEGKQLKIGSTVTVQIRSKIKGNLVVLDINSDGDVVQLFPNVFSGPKAVISRKVVEIPGENYGFKIRVKKPLGESRVLAIVGPPSFNTAAFIAEPGTTRGLAVEESPPSYFLAHIVSQIKSELSNKGLGIKPSTDWAMGEFGYVVTE
ncbi:DUF4384 domain-containing protein [Methylomonas fluvii]|uniref:DUF4384 domain-containing protein n=1 Tax=Methylomonas fluvii TaxID=1854564 RepID=A0ABR9DHK2_9GAMM|nr:DUF4384 domain-containing protein [Methylomonas fluvii]MBD9361763.1 DUF4384 domain-containing protein [Methylomonas fluvii]